MILDKSPVLRAGSYIVHPDTANLTPSGDFTLEFFDVVFPSAAIGRIWNHYEASGNLRSMLLRYSGTALQMSVSTDGTATVICSYTWTPTFGTPYQIAVDRSGTSMRLYVDGVVRDTQTVSGALFNTTVPLYIGIGISAGALTEQFAGTWKAVRFTNGVARYAGAYTPPSLPLPVT